MVPNNVILYLSGFAALVYEVSWNRQLGLLFGPTTHAAAVVLAAHFGGMAIGYAVGGRIANRVCPLRWIAHCAALRSHYGFKLGSPPANCWWQSLQFLIIERYTFCDSVSSFFLAAR